MVRQIGFADFSFFRNIDNEQELRFGCHQIRIYKANPNGASESLPCMTLLLRILEQEADFKEAPAYSEGCYQNIDCVMTESEKNVLRYYENCSKRSMPTLKEEILDQQERVQRQTGKKNIKLSASSSPEDFQTWIKESLSFNNFSAQETSLCFHDDRFFGYDQQFGIRINILKVFNLPTKNTFFNVVARILNPKTGEYLKTVITQKQNFEAVQENAEFICPVPYELKNVEVSSGSKIFFAIIGTDAVYIPDPRLGANGVVKPKDWKEKKQPHPSTTSSDYCFLGWSMVDLLETNSTCIKNGTHLLPIMEGDVPSSKNELQLQDEELLKNAVEKGTARISAKHSVLKMRIQHPFSDSENNDENEDKSMLEIFGNEAKYLFEESLLNSQGTPLNVKVVQTLPKKEQKLGTKSSLYKQAEGLYEKTMNIYLHDLVKTAWQVPEIELI